MSEAALARPPQPCPLLLPAVSAHGEDFAPNPPAGCLATSPPLRVAVQHQAVFCLSGNFDACSRYVTAAPAASGVRPLRFASLAAAAIAGLAITILVVGNPLSAEPNPASAAPTGAVPPATTPPPSVAPAHPATSNVPPPSAR